MYLSGAERLSSDTDLDALALSTRPRLERQVRLLSIAACLLATLCVGLAGWFAAERAASHAARRDAADFGEQAARVGLAPHVTDALLAGDAQSIDQLNVIWLAFMRQSRAVRVKIWRQDGVVVWSDDPRVIRQQFTLEPDEQALFGKPGVVSSISDLSKVENQFDRLASDRLVEVYVGLHTETNTPVLVESYFPIALLEERQDALRRSFLPILFGGLLLLAMMLVPLAAVLARRVTRTAAQREALRTSSLRASDDERRRMAAIVHDEAVQALVGMSFTLSAEAESAPAAVKGRLHELAGSARSTVSSLRHLIESLYPVDVPAGGWLVGINDLVQRIRDRRVPVVIDVCDADLTISQELLVLRVAREALTNILTHASPSTVTVRLVEIQKRILLEIVDDGCGFAADELEGRRQNGHYGLQLLEDATRMSGDVLLIDSTLGTGTVVRLELELQR